MMKLLQVADQYAVTSAPVENHIDEKKVSRLHAEKSSVEFFFYVTG